MDCEPIVKPFDNAQSIDACDNSLHNALFDKIVARSLVYALPVIVSLHFDSSGLVSISLFAYCFEKGEIYFDVWIIHVNVKYHLYNALD